MLLHASLAGVHDAHNFDGSMRPGMTGGGGTVVRNGTTLYFAPEMEAAVPVHRRLAELLRVPRANVSQGVDRSRLLAYSAGGYYLPHFDSVNAWHLQLPPRGTAPAELTLPFLPRVATSLLTLGGSFAGGELVFPYGGPRGCARARRAGVVALSPREAEREVAAGAGPWGGPSHLRAMWHNYFGMWGAFASNCSQLRTSNWPPPPEGSEPVIVRPGVGSAVLFFSHLPGRAGGLGELDPCALHMGCRVSMGRKVVLATWLHGQPK